MVGGQFAATQFLAEVDGHPDDLGVRRALEELALLHHRREDPRRLPRRPGAAHLMRRPPPRGGRRARPGTMTRVDPLVVALTFARDLRRRAPGQDLPGHARPVHEVPPAVRLDRRGAGVRRADGDGRRRWARRCRSCRTTAVQHAGPGACSWSGRSSCSGRAAATTRRPGRSTPPGPATSHGARAILASFLVLFAAEWGDLSQLLTLTLVAKYDDPVSVFVGALAALLTVSGARRGRRPGADALGAPARAALRRGRRSACCSPRSRPTSCSADRPGRVGLG